MIIPLSVSIVLAITACTKKIEVQADTTGTKTGEDIKAPVIALTSDLKAKRRQYRTPPYSSLHCANGAGVIQWRWNAGANQRLQNVKS